MRVALAQRDDILIREVRIYPFFFAPNARTVWPFEAPVAAIKNFLPFGGGLLAQRREIVAHFQQIAALRALINDGVEAVIAGAIVEAMVAGG